MCASAEACGDGRDDDCDGAIDEDCCATDADCTGGALCVGGSCTAGCVPRQELCDNGIDEDCNGVADDCGHACGADAECPGSSCYDGFCAVG